jgi:hypothetical protein
MFGGGEKCAAADLLDWLRQLHKWITQTKRDWITLQCRQEKTMTVLGLRFCHVAAPEHASAMAAIFGNGLAMPQLDLTKFGLPGNQDGFTGAIFPAADNSWVEVWPEGEGMPAGTMLQVVVDDADAYAATARANGLEPSGPVDAHGERIYYLSLPGGLPMSFQSRRAD